jgi:TolB protein
MFCCAFGSSAQELAEPADPLDPSKQAGAGWEDYPMKNPILLTVGPSGRAPDPVAVAAPTCRTGQKWCDTVQNIVARDLMLSGFFKVLDPESFIADKSTETLDQTKWEDWFNVGSKYLIKSEVEGAGKGNFVLSFRLYDVNQKKVIPLEFQEAAVSQKQLRRAVHKFVNEVIRAITGTKGPFGGLIVYAAKTGRSSKGVFGIDVDGYGRSSLSPGDSINFLPSMSGGHLVYTSFREGKPAIYIDGKRATKDDRAYRGARIAPGGEIIAVSADDGEGQSDIYLMDLEGNIEKNLTKHWADEVSPSWSPSGGQIAFVSNRSGSPQIYLMGAQGGKGRRVTFAGGYNSTPDFGPDGLIVFAGMDEAHSDVFVTDLGGNITRVTQDQGNNKDPTWSPDGRHLAFVSDRDGRWKIFVSTADGRYQFPITDKIGSFSTLFWTR